MSYGRREKKKIVFKSKPCRFCADKDSVVSYKMPQMLGEFLTERGKIISRRVTGNCQYHQNRVVEAINRARQLALLPYTITHAVRQ